MRAGSSAYFSKTQKSQSVLDEFNNRYYKQKIKMDTPPEEKPVPSAIGSHLDLASGLADKLAAVTRLLAEKHGIIVDLLDGTSFHTGRPHWSVTCATCKEVIKDRTNNPFLWLKPHQDEGDCK